jgi:hypothetical protein
VRKRKNNTIIVGYYGIGKSYLVEEMDTAVELVYSKCQPTVRQLKEALEEYDIILADPRWLQILQEGHYEFHIAIPAVELKDEYLERFKARYEAKKGNGSAGFRTGMANRWDSNLERLRNTPCLSLTILNKGQYLADVIDKF